MNDTIKLENKKGVKMVAHRGLSGLERENTCPAFTAAANRSYFGIETDVHVTRDGKLILCHDSSLARVAGREMIIEESDFDALRAVRFTDLDGTEREDVFLPTLGEYLHICKKYSKSPVIEIKERFTEEQVLLLISEVEEMDMLSSTVFISFFKESCLAVKKFRPNAKVQFLAGKDLLDEAVSFCIENDLDADFHFVNITKEIVDAIHASGHVINAWTVNDTEDAERLISIGIDYITTNILE